MACSWGDAASTASGRAAAAVGAAAGTDLEETTGCSFIVEGGARCHPGSLRAAGGPPVRARQAARAARAPLCPAAEAAAAATAAWASAGREMLLAALHGGAEVVVHSSPVATTARPWVGDA
jgi:hypothetical protein